MRLKPRYIIVIILVIFLSALIPWVDGYIFKSRYTALLTKISSEDVIPLEILEYHLGWLNSTAKIGINFTPTNPDANITIEQQISHGPFLKDPITNQVVYAFAAIRSVVHLSKKLEATLGSLSSQGIAEVTTLATFHGNFTNQFNVSSLSMSMSDQDKMMTQGLKGIVDVEFPARKLRHVSTEIDAGTLFIQSPQGTLSMQGMTSLGDRTCPLQSLCSGTTKTSIPEIDVANSDGLSFKLNNLNFLTSYSVDDQHLYNGYLQLIFDKWTAPTYLLGPVNLQFWLSNVDATALLKFIDIVKQTKNKLTLENGTPGQKALLSQLNNIFPQLLTINSVANADIKVTTSLGNASSVAKLFWPANTPLPHTTADETQNISFQMNIRAAAALIDQLIKTMDGNQIAIKLPGLTTTSTPTPVSTDIDSEVNAWVQQNQMSDDIGKQIILLQKQHFSPEIYSIAMDKLVANGSISSDIASTLKDQYEAASNDSGSAVESDDTTTSSSSTTPATANSVGTMKTQLDALINQNYIIRDKADYIIYIAYEKGAIKINGIPYPSAVSQPVIAPANSNVPNAAQTSPPGLNNAPGIGPIPQPGLNNALGIAPIVRPGQNNAPGAAPTLPPGLNNAPGAAAIVHRGLNNAPGAASTSPPGLNNTPGVAQTSQLGHSATLTSPPTANNQMVHHSFHRLALEMGRHHLSLPYRYYLQMDRNLCQRLRLLCKRHRHRHHRIKPQINKECFSCL